MTNEDKVTIKQMIDNEAENPSPENVPTQRGLLEQILTAPTPIKTLDEYVSHPLNYDGKNSTGRIIRGTEGIIGNLDKAVIDLIMGLVQKFNETFGKEKVEQTEIPEGI